MRRWARIVSVVGALALMGAVPAGAAPALPVLSHHGRWLTDPDGRVVILHGVQIDKFMPSRPVEWIDLAPANARFIGAEGFDLARVSLAYAGIEAQPGQFDGSYLSQYLALDRRLARAGVYDLLDLQQGEYSQAVGGNGLPDWMTITGGLPNNHAPFAVGYLDNPAEQAAWDNFWANRRASDGAGLEDHYARGLAAVARAFAGAPAMLGLDVMNEPWPGLPWPSCASPAGCIPGGFDQTGLTSFYRRVLPAVRAADPRHLIAYEPNLLFDYGAATQLGHLGDPDLMFAFHNYCLANAPGLSSLPDPIGGCGIEENLVIANALARARATGDAPLMDEWGDTTGNTQLNRITAEADKQMVGWSYWAYEDCCNSPAAIVANGTEPPTAAGNLRTAVLGALVRPYPKLIAGTPTGWSYDPATDRFTLMYSTAPVTGTPFPAGADTEVELPALKYPTGYDVTVTGARATSAPDANLLRIVNDPGAGEVRLTVTPANHHPPASGPFSWPAGAAVTPADCPALTARTIRLVVPQKTRRIVRVVVLVDGRRAMVAHGRRLVRVRLPAGLADGTAVQLTATSARRRIFRTGRTLRGCEVAHRSWVIAGRGSAAPQSVLPQKP